MRNLTDNLRRDDKPSGVRNDSTRLRDDRVRPADIKVRPWWLPRMLGLPKFHEVEAGDAAVIFKAPSGVTEVALDEIDEISSTSGFFTESVTVKLTNGRSLIVNYLPMRTGDALRTEIILRRLLLRIRQNSAKIMQAFEEADQLFRRGRFLNQRSVREWRQRHLDLFRLIPGPLPGRYIDAATKRAIDFCRDLLTTKGPLVHERNEKWVAKELEAMKEWFDQAEANPLTLRQREAVLKDEDHCLVVAGAGTGKTSTVVAKVGYLLKRKHATPDQILILAFAQKAKEELESRLRDRFGVHLEVRTFHGLGLAILGEADGRRPTLAKVAEDDAALDQLLEKCVTEAFEDTRLSEEVVRFFAYYLRPSKSAFDCKTQDEYLENLKSHNIRTLLDEPVKSHEELMIANWLFRNGITYDYECPYQEADTADRLHRQYLPDFRLTDSGVYIEHFGVDRNGNTAPFVDRTSYQQGMDWKRAIHSENKTRLVETYSYERMEGKLLERLEKKLRKVGVVPAPISNSTFLSQVRKRGEVRLIVSLLKTFLNLYKSHPSTLATLRKNAPQTEEPARTTCFLNLFEVVNRRYERHLREEKAIDFHDMIKEATGRIRSGSYCSPFRCIIVDEFQDISLGRAELVKALLKQAEDPRLFCVGDDWQSIFRFTGSDIGIMTQFERYFGVVQRTDLDQTFRFNDRILDASTKFITTNSDQLQKEMTSTTRVRKPPISVRLARASEKVDDPLLEVIREITKDRKGKSVMLLGRYNHTFKDIPTDLLGNCGRLQIQRRTVHRAKGLEADYVVVMDVSRGKYGFPSEVTDDPLLGLLLPGRTGFPHAEERRLFYVALTRARHKVYLLADESSRSCFLDELHDVAYAGLVDFPQSDFVTPTCRVCKGRLVRRNGKNGFFWSCANYPYCSGKGSPCPKCRRGVLIIEANRGKCNYTECGYVGELCPSCGGFMIPRGGSYGSFLGCSNFPDCRNTRNQ